MPRVIYFRFCYKSSIEKDLTQCLRGKRELNTFNYILMNLYCKIVVYCPCNITVLPKPVLQP